MFDGSPPLQNPCLPCLLLGNPSNIPEPAGEVTYLGTMLELQHQLPDGSDVRHSWSVRRAPHLFWSEKRKALYSFPGLKMPKKRSPATGRSAGIDAYRRWTGRDPRGKTSVRAPRAAAAQAGAAYYILYRSDKWTPAFVNYIHPFEEGVHAVLGAGKPPSVFMISGGLLRLTRRGLEG